MIQNSDLPRATKIRLPRIKYGLIRKQTHETIAKACGVKRLTIERDLSKWYGTEDFYIWLHDLWAHLYRKIKNDELVFREVSRLIGKGMTQRVESLSYEKIEETITVNVSEDEDEILSKAARILARKDKSRSLH